MTSVNESVNDNLKEEGSFANLYEETLTGAIKGLEAGKIIKAKVVDISSDDVLVDIGYKSEGRIPVKEFIDSDGKIGVKVGDEIEILVDRIEDDNGYFVLSKTKLDEMRAWELIEDSCSTGKTIEGQITKRVKGGFQVTIKGITAFLPGSQVDIVPVKDHDKIVGKVLSFNVLKFDRIKSNVIVSHRLVASAMREKLRTDILANIEEGKDVEGIVNGFTAYGAFIDLGGIQGLLHISDISWGRITHPSQRLSVGDRISVKVLKYNREDGKISLGLKQTRPDPWLTVKERYQIGAKTNGKVVNIAYYGAFIELEEGVEGLLHVSEIGWEKIKHPSDRVKTGDMVEVVVLDIDQQNKRISLSLKQLEENPWEKIARKYPKGSRIKGNIKNITDFGIFIGVDNGIDGMVHISDISWRKINHPSELYKKGQEIEAVVLNIDKANERFSLGIKQLEQNPWDEIDKRYSPGMTLKGVVKDITDFGAFIEIEAGIEGLVHISELDRYRKKGVEVKTGDRVDIEVLNVDPQEKKIGLSIRAVSKGFSEQPHITGD